MYLKPKAFFAVRAEKLYKVLRKYKETNKTEYRLDLLNVTGYLNSSEYISIYNAIK